MAADREPGAMQKRFLPIWLAGFAALALAGCDGKAEGGRPPLRPVLVAPAHYTTLGERREFTAAIRPRVESDLAFRVSGKVVRRFVEVGQRVKAGETLALLDEVDLKLQKEQADAEFAAAAAALKQANADETRAEKLHKDGWTAQAALDRAHVAEQEARARKERAARAVELAKNGLDYASLRADADGVVVSTLVEPGSVVAAGAPAVRLARSGELEAAVALPEGYVKEARAGEAKLALWSAPSRLYTAKLRELSPSADAATRNFAARFSILNPDPQIALGMSATLTIVNASEAPAIAVPMSALFNDGGGPALWRVNGDGGLDLVKVTLQRYEFNRALVTGPIRDGDRIVVLGVHKLDKSQKVRVIEQQ